MQYLQLFTDYMLKEMNIIPQHVYDNLNHNCEICGTLIGNNKELTFRRCINKDCYGHMKYLADDMFKKLGYKNIGPETCYTLLVRHQLKNHFQLIPYVTDIKPVVHLHNIAEVAGIPGLRSKWEDMLRGYNTFEEYFDDLPTHEVRVYAPLLIEAQKYFSLKRTLAYDEIKVMISGNLQGYTKQQFVNILNDIAGHIIRVNWKNSKNASVDYMICENKLSTTEKMKTARINGIPILTSKEFKKLFQLLLYEKLGK